MYLRLVIPLLVAIVGISCGTTSNLSITDYRFYNHTISSGLPQDTQIVSFLQPYKLRMDSLMNEIIGYMSTPLTKAQPECTAGNFMADAQFYKARQIDTEVIASVMNYGGIRVPYIPPGAITKRAIYELMPFDNKLTIVEISGKGLLELCDHMAAMGGWPVKGISFQIKEKKALNVLINNNPVNEKLIYKVVMSDYLATGGDQCDFLLKCSRKVINLFIRDVLIEYMDDLNKRGDSITITLENRISYVE